MNDSVDVEEIMERIRDLARARAQQRGAAPRAPQSPSLGQRLKNLWRTAMWYAQNPIEFPTTLTDRVLLARSIEELRVVVSQIVLRLDTMAASIEDLSVRLDRMLQSGYERSDEE